MPREAVAHTYKSYGITCTARSSMIMMQLWCTFFHLFYAIMDRSRSNGVHMEVNHDALLARRFRVMAYHE